MYIGANSTELIVQHVRKANWGHSCLWISSSKMLIFASFSDQGQRLRQIMSKWCLYNIQLVWAVNYNYLNQKCLRWYEYVNQTMTHLIIFPPWCRGVWLLWGDSRHHSLLQGQGVWVCRQGYTYRCPLLHCG